MPNFNDQLYFEYRHTNLISVFPPLDTVKQLDQFMEQRRDMGDNPAPGKVCDVMHS